jgi:hypothetical protein
VNQHWADRHEVTQKPGNIDACARINRRPGHGIQIVIERDQRHRRKERFALGNHRRHIAPDLQFKATPQRQDRFLKRCDAFVVVFEDEMVSFDFDRLA